MRLPCTLLLLPLLLLSVACATPARLVVTATDTTTTVTEVADELFRADVIALGEEHQTPAIHEVHHDLLRALQQRRGNVVIAMEMFERDVQGVLLQYLSGVIDEPTFLDKARPWPHYERDYRPVIEFAKEHGLVVLAANAPRALATMVSKEGIEAVAGNRFVARETTAPEDDYWDAFVVMMKTHGGTSGEGAMKRFYQAQCLKDDTMAESIVDHLKARRAAGGRPLVVLFCGHMHSDHGRGTVARIKSRMPGLDIHVLSAETVEDLSAGTYTVPRTIGEYVVVAEGRGDEEPQAAAQKPGPSKAVVKPPSPHVAKPVEPAPKKPAAAANPEGMRPALGLMPDYDHQGSDGVLVASVREGGSADKAGIEAGDLIVAVSGTKVTDVQSYSDVLDTQIIGKTITVHVKRETAEVDLQVLVGSRAR